MIKFNLYFVDFASRIDTQTQHRHEKQTRIKVFFPYALYNMPFAAYPIPIEQQSSRAVEQKKIPIIPPLQRGIN